MIIPFSFSLLYNIKDLNGEKRTSKQSYIMCYKVHIIFRYDELGSMDRVLSRIHNLELLALR